MRYHLFEVAGIELEYMVVRRKSLKVFPAVDQLLTAKNGSFTSDLDNGAISWSNELVAHVIELKTNGPAKDLTNLGEQFHKNVQEINQLLSKIEAQLLPTAAHPFMNPVTEMTLWKHSYSEIYALYNRIFNCKGHGWSNVQSMHINLPFYDDAEFEQLHAAVRVLLPIIPSISASSPIFEGKVTGFKDSRLEVYKTNQKEIPIMTGKVIPEQVFSKKAYYDQIFEPIKAAIKPFDTENILDHHFLNSRGAIARFDRHAIEIRVIDVQECPKADLAVAMLIIESLKYLIRENKTTQLQQTFHEDDLFKIFDAAIKDGEEALIENTAYSELFGKPSEETSEETSIISLWKRIYRQVKSTIPRESQETLEFILREGSLSTRILKAVGTEPTAEKIHSVYQKLGNCLEENKLFVP